MDIFSIAFLACIFTACAAFLGVIWLTRPERVAAHYHKDDAGILVRCYHHSVSVLKQPGFWVGNAVTTIIGFPFEHYLYDKVYPFTLITHWLGIR